MALIKCSECGKEVSDKAISCPNCGTHIFENKIEIASKKKWKELSNKERAKITTYKKATKQFWSVERKIVLSLCIIVWIINIIFISTENIIFLFIEILSLFVVGIITTLMIPKMDQKWYEENVIQLLEKGIL